MLYEVITIFFDDVLFDTGSQVNGITLKTLLYAAAIDHTWSNAILTGSWDHDWHVRGIDATHRRDILGVITLPVFEINGNMRPLQFAVYEQEKTRIVIGLQGLKDLKMHLYHEERKEFDIT